MSLDQIPDEIIQHLLYYVSAEDNLTRLQPLSRRLYALANECLLWKHHCCSYFKFWDPSHDFPQKHRQPVVDVDWKRLFLLRSHRNRLISTLFDSILETKLGRLRRIETICRLGYDAKDFLISQCQLHESAEDVLARRYYGNAILDAIHRSIAVEDWYRLGLERNTLDAQTSSERLETGLAGFDMFVLHDQPGDIEDISRILDNLADEFRENVENPTELTTRQRALSLNRWIRRNNLTGLRDPERNYRNLRNCFIGQALRHEQHDSIPIISSAIFCSLARRIGLSAQCCAFPGHVHAIVLSRPGYNLDDLPTGGEDDHLERMYLDPFGSDDEIPTSTLQQILSHFGWQTSTDAFLAPVSPQSMMLRTAQNIKATFSKILELQEDAHSELSQLLRGNSVMNVEAAVYAALWAGLMLTPPNTFEWDDRLASFLRRFAGSWPEDAWLVEKYLWPMYNSFAPLRHGFARHVNRGLGDPWEHWRLVRDQDVLEPPVLSRSAEGNQSVPFKIGEVFRHRRYGWVGVITGWSDQGTRRLPISTSRDAAHPEEGAPSGSQSEPAPRPANQFYFMCFPSTGSEPHVVAADNIELLRDGSQISDDMFPLAGKFFKRFDRSTCTFVSNNKEQYPDD